MGTSSHTGRVLEDRVAASLPYPRLKTAHGCATLLLQTLREVVRRPGEWFPTCVEEMHVSLRRMFWPLTIAVVAFAWGTAITTLSGTTYALGTPDRYFGPFVAAWTREAAIWVPLQIFAGVMGSAITADIAARKIRDELDAIRVLGVNPVRSLVVPRVVAMTLASPLFACFSAILALGIVFSVAPMIGVSYTAAMDGARSFITEADLISMLVKSLLIGLIIGIVSCYKGLEAGGGAEGVGIATKQTVIISIFMVWLISDLWNQVFLAMMPDLATTKG